jgi:hypothetical protein
MSEQFFLTVSSDSNCGFSNENKPSNFKVHLGHVLELQGSWEIALFEIFVPSTLSNVRKGTCKIIHEKTSFDLETGELGFKGDKGHRIIDIESDSFLNIGTLVKEINMKLAPSLHCKVNEKKVTVYLNELDESGDISAFYFSTTLNEMLGLPRFNSLGGNVHNIGGKIESLGGTFADGKLQSTSNFTSVQSEAVPNVNKGLTQTLCVCTSLVSDQIVNNSHARILRSFDTEASKYKPGFTRKVEFAKLKFVPLAKHKIEYVDIYIKDDIGQEASFSHGTLTAVLLLRKVSHE